MGEQQQIVQRFYEAAKQGDWEQILLAWSRDHRFSRECSRFQNSSSGWTFLHQAAYHGDEAACRELIRAGASVDALSRDGQRAADIAEERKLPALVALLQRAAERNDSLWKAPKDPDLLPSSGLWYEAQERWAAETMRVAYGGGVVTIPTGTHYYVDSFERTLVGWHGSYDPPCGMDGESMLE
jgi:hypothetical protein